MKDILRIEYISYGLCSVEGVLKKDGGEEETEMKR